MRNNILNENSTENKNRHEKHSFHIIDSNPLTSVLSFVMEIYIYTRLSYYNVTTRLVDLVGLSWLKQN